MIVTDGAVRSIFTVGVANVSLLSAASVTMTDALNAVPSPPTPAGLDDGLVDATPDIASTAVNANDTSARFQPLAFAAGHCTKGQGRLGRIPLHDDALTVRAALARRLAGNRHARCVTRHGRGATARARADRRLRICDRPADIHVTGEPTVVADRPADIHRDHRWRRVCLGGLARVANAVAVRILLARVCDVGAVVLRVADPVAVSVGGVDREGFHDETVAV